VIVSLLLAVLLFGAVAHATSPFDDEEASSVPGDDMVNGGLEEEDVQEEQNLDDADQEEEQEEQEPEESEEAGDDDEEQEDAEESEDDEDSEDRRRRVVRGFIKGGKGGKKRCNNQARALKKRIAAARARLARINAHLSRFSRQAGRRHRRGGKKAAAKKAAPRRHGRRHGRRHHGRRSLAAWKRTVKRASQLRGNKARKYAKWHRLMLGRMWKAVRRSRHAKNRQRYFKMLRMFRQLKGAWARRRALLRRALQQRRANKIRSRYLRMSRRQALRRVARRFRKSNSAARARYEQSYMRYLKLIAKFFRRKYKVLVTEYLREHRQNIGLKNAMAALKAQLHTALEAKDLMAQLRRKRQALAHWKKVAQDLRAKLAAVKAQLATLTDKHNSLRKVHAETHRNLVGANNNISQLRAQIAALQSQLNQSKASLDACKMQLSKAVADAKAAADAANNKYNALMNEYKAALAKHGALSKQLTDENNRLKADLAEAKKNVCIPDVCGKCGGDESSCALRTAAETCHAVGDPHYRSYSGFTFDYQITGEFSLSRHLNDFEVQNLQQPCPNPAVRCNKAFAVRAGKHVIVVYAAWGTGTILVDGVRTRTTLEQRVAVDDVVAYIAHGNMVEVHYRDAVAKGYINPWADTQYMDLYVTVPGRWSTGRSLFGLCGAFNGDAGADQRNVANGQQYWVANTDRSLFRNPNPRTEADIQVEDQMHESQVAAQSVAIRQAIKEAGTMSGQPSENLKLVFKDAAQKKMIEDACSSGVHGSDKLDCMYDLLAGASSTGNRRAYQMSQLLDHEKLLDPKCITIDGPNAAQYAAKRLAADERSEGFSYAFWFKPSEANADVEKSILSRATAFSVNTKGDALVVRHGSMSCASAGVVAQNTWIQVVVAVAHSGSLKVYVDGKRTCTQHEDDPPKAEFGDSPLVVADAAGTPAKGTFSRLFYLPLTVKSRDVVRYSERHRPNCEREATEATETETQDQ